MMGKKTIFYLIVRIVSLSLYFLVVLSCLLLLYSIRFFFLINNFKWQLMSTYGHELPFEALRFGKDLILHTNG